MAVPSATQRESRGMEPIPTFKFRDGHEVRAGQVGFFLGEDFVGLAIVIRARRSG